MKITKKENLFYTDKLESLGITYHDVCGITKDFYGLKSQICKDLNIASSSLSCVLSGDTNNPRIVFNVYQYLMKRHNNNYFNKMQNLKKEEKTLDYLLMNGFSYWEAVRIAG